MDQSLSRSMPTQSVMEPDRNCFFRDQLRAARAMALADAAGFHEVLRAIELIGQQKSGDIKGLGYYKPCLSDLASRSEFAGVVPTQYSEYHTGFDTLFNEMRQARNDAVHQGAYARTLTHHAVELALILEDALMAGASTVSQFMVRSVVEAKKWHPISYVRQQMLTHAFSYLPILLDNAWKFIPEYAVARLLRNASSPAARTQCLLALVKDTVAHNRLELLDARILSPDTSIAEVSQFICERPVLVVDEKHPDALLGLLTASDIL
jgi:predicted transcriptional regulator